MRNEKNEEDFEHSRKSTIQRDDLMDKINDLTLKVALLEKMMAGGNKNGGDEKNPEKLPSINKIGRKREGNFTVYQEKSHEKQALGRRDLS